MALLNPLRLLLLGRLFIVFIIALIQSASRVAIAAVSPLESLKPAVVAVPLDLRTDLGIATLANMVSLTPGTTSLHVSQDRKTLYVHVLDNPGTDAVAQDIKGTFEGLIRRIEDV